MAPVKGGLSKYKGLYEVITLELELHLSVKENVFFLINNFASKEDGAGKKKKPQLLGTRKHTQQ